MRDVMQFGRALPGAISGGSMTQTMTRSVPPLSEQVSISLVNTRLRHGIPFMGAVGLSASVLPRLWRGTMRTRCLKLGANTH